MEDKHLDWLAHFNKYHDPKNGQFTSGTGIAGSSKTGSKNTKGSNDTDAEYNKKTNIITSNVNWKKAAIIGGVAVGASLAAIGGYKLYKSGALDKYIAKGKDAIKDLPVNRLGKSYAELDRKMIKKVNGVGPITHGRQINCTHTTTAYILNSLYDRHVIAKPFDGYDEIYDQAGEGRDMRIFEDIFDGLKVHDYVGDNSALSFFRAAKGSWEDRINDIAPGSTGILWVASPLGASHVINYEKTVDGAVTLIDCQSKKIIKGGLATTLFKMSGMWKIARSLDFSDATIKEGSEKILGTMIEWDNDFKPTPFKTFIEK